MDSSYGLYAYGLVGKCPAHLAIRGIDKQHKVYPVIERDMCVIVSQIDIDEFQNQVKRLFASLTETTAAVQSATREILQAHADVVETLMQTTTIVPFKFGTILKDEAAASTLLQNGAEQFQKLLARCTDRAEWGLKIYVDRQACLQQRMQLEPALKNLAEQRTKLSNGVAYLFGRKIEEELKSATTAWLTTITQAIFQELAKAACEARLCDPLPQKLTGKNKEMALNTVFLVEKTKEASFCQQGKKLQAQYETVGLDVEISGPWPPYSFV